MTLYAVTFVLFVNKQTVIIKAFDYAKSLIEVCERIWVPILNLKNSRFFTFSALNASFLSTQGMLNRLFRWNERFFLFSIQMEIEENFLPPICRPYGQQKSLRHFIVWGFCSISLSVEAFFSNQQTILHQQPSLRSGSFPDCAANFFSWDFTRHSSFLISSAGGRSSGWMPRCPSISRTERSFCKCSHTGAAAVSARTWCTL